MKAVSARMLVTTAVTGLMAIALPPGASAAQGAGQSPATETAPADPAAVAALIASMNTVLDAQPAKASVDDIEAALIFAIDQSQQPKVVILAALEGIDTTSRSKNAKAAIERLKRKIAKEIGLRGTGGIGANNSGLGAGPSVGGGSNGTDYTGNR